MKNNNPQNAALKMLLRSRHWIMLAILAFLSVQMSQAQTCTGVAGGTYSVGPTGTYASLTDALTAVNAGVTGPVILELESTYVSNVETTFPITFPSNSCLDQVNTLTIRPQSGASGLLITSNNTAGTINFNGADYVIIDGRPGGVGASQLTISNTNVGTSYAINFSNDATFNNIQFCTITSKNTSVTSGTIVIGGGVASGNDNNTISNCSVSDDASGSFATNAIYSSGTSVAVDNSNNTLANNNISNFYSATVATNGILLTATGNNTWSIINNKIFQTNTRVYTTAQLHNGINILSGSGYTITGNIIGFANASGTGTTNMIGNSINLVGFPLSYSASGTANATRYIGLNCTFTAGGAVSSIQDNTIAGFALYTSSGISTTTWCGINVNSGNANIGNLAGNNIGSGSAIASIYIAGTASGGTAVGIFCNSANTVIIQNNSVGGFDVSGTTTSTIGGITGIDVAGTGTYTISGNFVGSALNGNMRTGFIQTGTTLSAGGSSLTQTSGLNGAMMGIRSTSTGSNLSITGNIIRGFRTSGTLITFMGISSTGNNAASVTMNNNLLGTNSTELINYTVANSGALIGINLTAVPVQAAASSHSIQNNDIRGIVNNVAGSQTHTYINFNAGTGAGNSSTISNNTFTNLSVNTTGAVVFVAQSYVIAPTGTLLVNNNAIVTGFTRLSSGSVTGISNNTASGNGSIENITNNNFSNITVVGASNIIGFNISDGGSTKQVTGNVFNNWNGTTGTINSMNFHYWNGASSLSNNTITNLSGQGNVVGITLGSLSSAANPLNVNLNTISNLNSTAGNVTAITCANASTVINISNNTITSLSSNGNSSTVTGIAITGSGASTNVFSNTISGLTGAGATSPVVNGISVSNGNISNVYSNTISGLSGSGTLSPIANGILVSGGTTTNLFRNKIYDITQNGTISTTNGAVNGITLSNGVTVNAYNNLIGDLKAPDANLADAIRGINVSSAASSASYNVSYNNIYLNATSSGANFGSTGIYHTANATSTNSKLDLRNNIVINLSTPSGTGITTALRRSTASTLNNFAPSSNRNMLFAGTPGSSNLIMFDGTNSYRDFGPSSTNGTYMNAASPRDAGSMTGEGFAYSTPGSFFQSLTGSSAQFLHLVNGITTQIEGGASQITFPAITNDFDGDVRNTTSPDIGADEFNGITPSPTIALQAVVPSTLQCNAVPHNVSVDAGGSISGVTITYSFNGIIHGTFAMTNTSGSTWSYTIPAAVPENALVEWFATATNSASLTASYTAASYSDAPLFGANVLASASSTTVCEGSSITLTGVTNTYSENFENASFPLTSLVVAATSGSYSATQNSTYFAEGASSVRFNTASANASGTLTTSNINISTFPGPQLTFKHIAALESPLSSFDFGYVEYSIDGGATWVIFPQSSYVGSASTGVFTGSDVRFSTKSYSNWISTFTSASSLPNNTLWQTETFNIPAAALTSTQFKVRFRYTTDGSGNYYGWLIDDVMIGKNKNFTSLSWSSAPAGFTANTKDVTVSPLVSTTYTFTAVDANGCTVSASTPLVEVISPSITSVIPASRCGAGTVDLSAVSSAGTIVNWYANATGGTPIGTGVTFTTPLIASSTNFYAAAYDVSEGCESGRTLVLATVTPSTPIVASSTSSLVCDGNTSSIEVSSANPNYSYDWTSTPSGFTASGAGPHVVTLTGSGTTFQVYGFDAGTQCGAVSTVTINTIPNQINLTATSTPVSVCYNSDAQLIATAALPGNPAASFTYDWSANSNYLNNTGIANPIAQSVQTSEIYSVTVTDNSTGCVKNATITLDVLPLPVPSAFSNAPICENSDILLFAFDGANYTWTGPNNFTTTGYAGDASIYGAQLTNSGNYTVDVIGSNGCTASETIYVQVNDNPEPYISSVNDVSCSGLGDGYFQVGVNGGTPFFSFNELSQGQNYSGFYGGLSAGTYYVDVTDLNQCISQFPLEVIVNSVPNGAPVISCPSNITINSTPGMCGAIVNYITPVGSDVCPILTTAQTAGLASGLMFPVGTTVNTFRVTDVDGLYTECSFSVTVTETEAPIITNCPSNFSTCNPVTWTPPTITDNCSGLVVTSSHVPNTNFPAGTTTVTYTATDAYNNVSTCSFQVTRLEESVPATSITSDRDFNNICAGESVNLTINGGTVGQGSMWKWYKGTCGGTQLTAFNGMSTINVAPTVTTTYFARAEGQCNTTACVSITVVVSTSGPANGVLAITNMPPFGAPGVTGTIDCTPVPGATFYRWSSINGHINAVWFPSAPGPVDTNVPSVNVLFNQSLSNYQIRVIAGNACGRTNNVAAHIRGTVPASTCLTGPVVACPNTTATYSVASCTIPNTSSYQWAITGNATITAGQGTPTITVSFGAGFSTGTVCVNGITNFGLAGPQTCLTVSNNAVAPGSISGNNQPCQSGFESYTIAPVTGATSYLWSTTIPGATASGTSTTGTVQFPSGSFSGQVCVQSISSCGMSVTSCYNVTSGVAGIPGPILGPESGICGAVGNYALSTNDAISYNWILPSGVTFASANGSNSVQLQFPSTPGSHVITVEAFYDCGSATSTITVDGAPGTPTVTPATICAGGTDGTYIASAAGSDTYNWTTSGALFEQCTNPNCSNYYIIWDVPGGSFSVEAVNACGVSAVPFSLSTNCRINEEGKMETKVYPNPTSGLLTVEFNSYAGGTYNMMVTDMSGRMVLNENVMASSGNNEHKLDLERANPGMYMLYVKDGNGKISVTKITVE